MQLDVIASMRRGLNPRRLPSVPANHVLNLLCVCRQIFEEAHGIFWGENVFIFADLHTMYAFLHRIGARSSRTIKMLGVEMTDNEKRIHMVDGDNLLRYSFSKVQIPLSLLSLHLPRWETRVEEFSCPKWFWTTEDSYFSKSKRTLIPCMIPYNWLTRPTTSKMEMIQNTVDATNDDIQDLYTNQEPFSHNLTPPNGSAMTF